VRHDRLVFLRKPRGLTTAARRLALRACDTAQGVGHAHVGGRVRQTRQPVRLGKRRCPDADGAVAALDRWLAVAGIKDGPVFQGVTRGGRLTGMPLARQDIGRTLKAMGKRVGLPVNFRAHSLRVGMAHDLTLANVESNLIMQAAGWTTPRMLARCTEDLNAGNGAIARFRGGSKRR
jgi:integrase